MASPYKTFLGSAAGSFGARRFESQEDYDNFEAEFEVRGSSTKIPSFVHIFLRNFFERHWFIAMTKKTCWLHALLTRNQ